MDKYVQPLPIPDVRAPDGRRQGADYHEIPLTEFTAQLHPDLPETTLWGYDGQYPGPIIRARRNERIKVQFGNGALPSEHLLSVDERIAGTTPDDYPEFDGPVPEVRTVTHFHGLNVDPENDGQAEMWTSPDGVTGPRFATHVHDIPNRQSRLTSSYHDHALGISRLNLYAGLVGFYFIRSRAEDRLDLPSGEYDIPLMLHDRSFNEDGSLHYPDSFEANVAGDTAVINGAVWPYLEVEPRRYRLRFVNTSNGRTYNMRLDNDAGTAVPTLYQVAAGHGFLERVVPIGPDGDLDSLLLSPFERGDVIVDFSDHAGETFTVTNDAEFPFEGHTEGADLDELMQIQVAESSSGRDTSTHPSDLTLPSSGGPDERSATETRQMTMSMTMDDHGLSTHLLNGRRFTEETQIKPQLGTTEVWELQNETHHTHPIHLHLVEFSVIGRGPDGTEAPAPNERVGKDVVRVNPDETVRIAAKFGDFTGQYPWHCHILEHEDHKMMRPFEVVSGSAERNGEKSKRHQNDPDTDD
ncbi:multicopper oxidase domain-containing protein [Halostella sp. JP-L12]|nr:multicopper oxidase domain-containing protein [Halostella sp. JP-L12]